MCFLKQAVLETFAKFTEKHLCQSLFFLKKVVGKQKLTEPLTRKKSENLCFFNIFRGGETKGNIGKKWVEVGFLIPP